MEKRATTTELNREGFEADVDGYCSRAPSSNSTLPLKFLTKEEILSSGRKLLRLKRTLTPSFLEHLETNTKESLNKLTGPLSHKTNCNENPTRLNMSSDSNTAISDKMDKVDNTDITLKTNIKESQSNAIPHMSQAASSEMVCEKVELSKPLEEKTPLHTESQTSCSLNSHHEKSIKTVNLQTTPENLDQDNVIKDEAVPKSCEITHGIRDSSVLNENKTSGKNGEHQTQNAPTADKIHFFSTDQVTTPIDREMKPSTGSSSECQPILGNFFNKQFTNPFAETAKQGEDKFSASQSFLSSMQPNETIIGSLSKGNTTELIDHDDPCPQASNDTISSIQFPGEEDDVELYLDKNVILLKCVPVKVEATELSKESDSGTEQKVIHKFKRQGEGVLRLLQKKNKGDTESDETKQTRRLVFRQRGTFTLLLNSPLWVSKTFDQIPELTGGFGVRFVGINPLVSKEENQVAFESYILKFKLEKQRVDFMDAVKKYQVV